MAPRDFDAPRPAGRSDRQAALVVDEHRHHELCDGNRDKEYQSQESYQNVD
jgi:hypothetical protein